MNGTSFNPMYLVNSLVFALVGMFVLAFGFWAFDKATPAFHLWKEILEEKNVALAVVVAAVTLGISIIIASAIHG